MALDPLVTLTRVIKASEILIKISLVIIQFGALLKPIFHQTTMTELAVILIKAAFNPDTGSIKNGHFEI